MNIHAHHCPFCGAKTLTKLRYTEGRKQAEYYSLNPVCRGHVVIMCTSCQRIIGHDNIFTWAFIERVERVTDFELVPFSEMVRLVPGQAEMFNKPVDLPI